MGADHTSVPRTVKASWASYASAFHAVVRAGLQSFVPLSFNFSGHTYIRNVTSTLSVEWWMSIYL